ARRAFLPLLLVASPAEALVERAQASEGGPADRHVRAPGERRRLVSLAEVERGDRRTLASAAARRRPLEAGEDAPREHVRSGVLAGGLEQRGEPAGAHLDVVVEEHHERARRALHAAVASRVQAEVAAVRQIARAMALGE